MSKIQVDTMSDNSEIVHYDTAGIPLYIRKGILSSYPGMRAQCHWHDDIELILILDGEMNYYVNGTVVRLNRTEGILIHAREMHYGYSSDGADCSFICVLFHPSLLSSCRKVFEEQVLPFLEQEQCSYLHLQEPQHTDILQYISKIWQLKQAQNSFYVTEVVGILHLLWAAVGRLHTFSPGSVKSRLSTDVVALRRMVSFLHSHYQESLSLISIADAANICKSKCCSIFREQLGQSPIDFLNCYRLHISADLLAGTSISISGIALECGFNHLSYYSKLFMRYYGCTPSEYRKSHMTSFPL